MNRMFNTLNNKLDMEYKDEINKKFKEYCAYTDLTQLENKVISAIDIFVSFSLTYRILINTLNLESKSIRLQR